jgi:hypothetical protein
VRLSRLGMLLAQADPAWTRRLSRGLRSTAIGTGSLAACLALLDLSLVVEAAISSAAASAMNVLRSALGWAAWAGGGLTLVGLWLSSFPDPRFRERRRDRDGMLLRASSLVTAIAAIGLVSFAGHSPLVRQILVIASVLGLSGAAFFGLRCLADVARRVPSPSSAELFQKIAPNAGGLTLAAAACHLCPYRPVQLFAGLAVYVLAWYLARVAIELPTVVRRLRAEQAKSGAADTTLSSP